MNSRSVLIEQLLAKGVSIPTPESVEIDKRISIDRISGDGVVIHAGCRIYGASTFIAGNVSIGREGPATVQNCQIGPEVNLGGGYFCDAVFLEGARTGANAHVREGTIMEENSSLAHAVGVKQTILFPFATLGSLINFCDCLLAGGTDSKNHSEVGSSFIHFNFSPNQDKATPSLFGDVPRGVMLRQRPVFLGGQGGVVGPLRLTFGSVTAAGTICRKDELSSGKLIFGKTLKGGTLDYSPGIYPDINRIVANNINYIASLVALMRWYEEVRSQFMHPVRFPNALLEGLKEKIRMGLAERIRRFEELCDKMPYSISLLPHENDRPMILLDRKQELFDKKEIVSELLRLMFKTEAGDEQTKNKFLEGLNQTRLESGPDYLSTIKALKQTDVNLGTIWLRSVVDAVVDRIGDVLPTFSLMIT
jgi:UDP-N-acetylglucosamine/UDP-N-acetylgalactosamine diphosphorylase